MAELPEETIEEATRLTKLARRAVDPEEASAYRTRRARSLAEHGFTARVREGDATETLVLHPTDWVGDGRIRTDRIEDVDRAIEVQVAGPESPDDWDRVEAHNRAVARAVREAHGEVHGENAEAFADFIGNHYAKRIDDATPSEREEFLAEYFVRNVWPSEDQKDAIERSLEYVERLAKNDPD
ncbi:DUF7108 family protein [Halalkalicoccus subterraneus]|uniref:DUF7108 family protein n=1 Tax=Halalkalicoccus subterraneus TaxID=2675002 RepID=UPI000EFB59F7|nr:rnhA operon protein [Halalkalicoccus subterraneus]